MITTRIAGRLGAGPQYRAGYGLGAGRMSYNYGDYGDVVNVRGGRRHRLGEVIRWAPLGPGGDPQMSLQGRRGLGEVIRWAPLGPGGNPQMSLQGIPMTMAEVDWYQLGVGAVLGIGAYIIARKQKWIK